MFRKAERIQAKIKIAIIGPSGSGKTKSALRLASGMGGKIAVIDCENKSASLYADQFDFDVMDLSPPFSTEKYNEAIKSAVSAGYDILIIDSISHAWAGEGGLMEQKEKLDSTGKGSSYTNWGAITKKHEAFKSTFLQANIHLICTMRSKQGYILAEDGKGKQVPKKVGMEPIQRDGIEYEFTTVFDVNMNHEAEVSKDRTGLFAEVSQITEKTGKILMKWMKTGKQETQQKEETQTPPSPPTMKAEEKITKAQLDSIILMLKEKQWSNEDAASYIKLAFKKSSSRDLTSDEAKFMINVIRTTSRDTAFINIQDDGPTEAFKQNGAAQLN